MNQSLAACSDLTLSATWRPADFAESGRAHGFASPPFDGFAVIEDREAIRCMHHREGVVSFIPRGHPPNRLSQKIRSRERVRQIASSEILPPLRNLQEKQAVSGPCPSPLAPGCNLVRWADYVLASLSRYLG